MRYTQEIVVRVFDEKVRIDDGPKTRDEGLFAFYDRAARRPFAIFRELVNSWLAEMPEEAGAEIAARMRKGDDLGFATGLSELKLHAALLRRGFGLEPHPDLPGTDKRLDFLLRRAEGERVAYLEITTINPGSERIGRDRREAVIFEAVNGASMPEDLRLVYEVAAFGTGSPSTKKLRVAVERWAQERAEAARGTGEVQEAFAIDDWRFRLSLIGGFKARPAGRRIAMYGVMNGRIVGAPPSTDGLGKALNAKANKYGDLDLPYLIAVFDRTDSLAWFSRDFAENVASVLFGSELVEDVVMASGEIRSSEARARDGWFGDPAAPRRRGVSAVLVFPSAEPWYLAEPRGQPLLVRNPWATRPLPEGILPVNELVIDEREGRLVRRSPMAEMLELPNPWPPEDA